MVKLLKKLTQNRVCEKNTASHIYISWLFVV